MKNNRAHKREYDRGWIERNRESYNTYQREYNLEIRKRVLSFYGNGKLACVKCGFTDIRALTIDHTNGGGNQHKFALGKYGINFYRWLIKEGLPEGYQTLCMNCQFIKVHINKEWR